MANTAIATTSESNIVQLDWVKELMRADPEVSSPQSADLAATSIDWFGIDELRKNPKYAAALRDKLPQPQEGDTVAVYTKRIWPLLTAEERGIALSSGMQRMVMMQRIAEVGVQVRVWRAFSNGEWQEAPEAPETFREWVRMVMVDTMDASPSEASQLATICEVVGHLLLNPIPGVKLPDDIESVFRRPAYRRWRAVAGRIAAAIKAAGNETPVEEANEAIKEFVDSVQDDDKTTQDLDLLGRKSSRVQPIIFSETGVDSITGTYHVETQLTLAQKTYMMGRLGDAVYQLKGETYDATTAVLAEYKHSGRYWWLRWYEGGDKPSDWMELDYEPTPGGDEGEYLVTTLEDGDTAYYRVWVVSGGE